jgi:ABC-type branched-subunit amino acid transport system permease subunit
LSTVLGGTAIGGLCGMVFGSIQQEVYLSGMHVPTLWIAMYSFYGGVGGAIGSIIGVIVAVWKNYLRR